MKFVRYTFLLMAVACAGCGLFDKTGNGFNEVLSEPPFKTISDSIDQFPNNATLLLQRAELLSQNNHHDIAYYDYKKSWELRPTEGTAMAFTSNLFLNGRNKEAIDLLKGCIAKYPANTAFMRRLAEAYTQSGKGAEAIGLYDDLLHKDSVNF